MANGLHDTSGASKSSSITRDSNRLGSLLSSTARVEAPFIRVSIGGYTFGVYEAKTTKIQTNNGVVSSITSKYPNYVRDLKIVKYNGTVNQYTLTIAYPVTENNDPNFFERLFGTVSKDRKISITYGDFMLPDYIYRDEEAIITKINNSFDLKSSVITYTISAVSASKLALSGTYTFEAKYAKPSDLIYQYLYDTRYKLTEVFTGMKNRKLVEAGNFIASDDVKVQVPTCTNISILEYLNILVSYMSPTSISNKVGLNSNVYSMTTFEDTTGVYGGPYFKVQKIQRASSALNRLCTYDIDVGYPTANIITDFKIENDDNWSLFYNYNRELENSDYLKRIDNKGNVEYVYSPQLTNVKFYAKPNDISWWTQVTQYPINVTLTLKGLLKPAILMQYVKLNVWFFGRKHISSGYYIITGQTDNIGLSGYNTTLKLVRVSPDDQII